MQRLREKIVEQEAEHIKLVNENNKLKADKQITVSLKTLWLCLIIQQYDGQCRRFRVMI